MSADDQQPLIVKRQDRVTTLTLNRPSARNSLNARLLAALETELSAIAADQDVAILVLRGADGFFCAGGDVKERRSLPLTGEASLEQRSAREGVLLAQLSQMPQLTLAAVEGGAIGAGLGMVCACDLVLCTAGAFFSAPEVLTGNMPAQIAPYILAQAGRREARRLLLTGTRITANEARAIGLVTEVLSDEADMDLTIARKLEQLAGIHPRAIAHTKALLRRLMPIEADYPRIAAEAYVALEHAKVS